MADWETTSKAAPILGMATSESVRYWVRKGLKEKWLTLGIHVKYKFPKASRPVYLLNIERCKKV